MEIQRRNSNCIIWKYFKRNDNKIADCFMCGKRLSYKSTVTNLKQHLRLKHNNAFNELLQNQETGFQFKPKTTMPKTKHSGLIWQYFLKNEFGDKIAECKACNKKLSYKTTVTNLKQHLKLKHSDTFSEFLEQDESEKKSGDKETSDTTTSEDGSSDSDDAAEELLKVTDIWSYFDTSKGRKAKCIVCKTVVDNDYEELKAHLKDNHPKLLLQILQDNDQKSDAASNDGDDDDNAFTEVVYLEQDPGIENVIKIKEKPKSNQKPIIKRERPVSFHTASEEIPAKIAKEDDELETFIKYIRCLLKKLPADVFSNVQAEIINTILKAQASTASTSRSINTSYSNNITIDGIVPVTSTLVGHNYTITVAPPITTDNEEERADS